MPGVARRRAVAGLQGCDGAVRAVEALKIGEKYATFRRYAVEGLQ
jgi:hypothetical protein